MNARRTLVPLACMVASALMLAACGGSSGPPAPVAIAFVEAPPNSVNASGSFMVEAAVGNTNNLEVNWSCAPSGACGSFNPTQTASGVATTYTAPTMVPAGGSVTITATSAADSTKFAESNVTVMPGGAITLTFSSQAPPTTLCISGCATTSAATLTVTITSTVAAAVNDGVTWTATCSGATSGCGTFSASPTNSGASTTYTAPASVPAGGLAVKVEATSVFDPTVSLSAVINVQSTTPAAFLCANCTYTFTASGEDLIEANVNGTLELEPSPYGIVGQFTTDGMGNIAPVGGEQDFTDLSGTTLSTPDTIMSGTYSFTPDGRGTITLNTVDRGAETLGVVLISSNHLLVTEFDHTATASGLMDLQTASQATLSGGYAYVAGGTELVDGGPLGYGGVFDVTGAGVISNSSGVCDANYEGYISTQQGYTSGSSYTGPDSFGRIQITLRADFIGNLNSKYNLGVTGPVILAAYITDATHLKFVEVDNTFGVASGIAVGQSGNLTTLPANSTYILTAFGANTGPYNLAAAVTSDGNMNLNNSNAGGANNSDVNEAGTPSTGSITGTYSVGSGGNGRVAVALQGVPLANVTGDKSGKTPISLAMYLTGGSDPAMTLELDDFGVATGSAYTQTSNTFSLTSISGQYGLNYTLFDPTGEIEYDATGQFFADGQGNLLGTQDVNADILPTQDQASTGTYASNATSRFTGTLISVPTGTLQISYYVVSPSEVVIIETDPNAVTLGVLQLQTLPF